MTVRELIAALQREDPDALVIIQKDPEGNGYAPCAEVDGNRHRYWADSGEPGGSMVRIVDKSEYVMDGWTEEAWSALPRAVSLTPEE